MNCWDAVVSVSNPTENEYNLNDVTMTITDSGTILSNVNVTYLDIDSDGLASTHDIIEITNIQTENPTGTTILFEYQGKRIGGVTITWDIEDHFRYMVYSYQMNTTQTDDIHYNTYFYIASIRGDNQINISDITIVIQKDADTILTNALVYVNDTDNNGFLSVSDRVEISNMTEKYRNSVVRLIINDIQVGYWDIYNFNLKGDTEGGIHYRS